jgi:DNA-binding NarL/FixJ family response regulator
VRKSILIADDNKSIRRLTRDFFEMHSTYEICGEAVDGIDVVAKAGELKPDLIILDLAMPGMNGLQAAKTVRTTSEVPIILFTMYAGELGMQDALSAGIDAVVSKVGPLAVLLSQVESLLGAANNL